MDSRQPFIRLKLDVHSPIELSEFVGAFTSIAAEFDRYVRAQPPIEGGRDSTLYVKDVRDGCIQAEIIPWIFGGLIAALGAANTVAEFVERYGKRLSRYLRPGGRADGASKTELKDFSAQVAAIANNPGSALEVAAVEIENGTEKVRAAFKFDTSQAREIRDRVEEHKRELDHESRADFRRVLMVFTRSDIGTSRVGERSGERVRIERIAAKPLPLIYASEMAERQIKHEIIEAEDNVYKKGFVVDVNVESRNGKPAAYSVTAVHQVVDLDED